VREKNGYRGVSFVHLNGGRSLQGGYTMSTTPIYDDLLRELEGIAQEAGPTGSEPTPEPATS
jgi:hypothetical protein